MKSSLHLSTSTPLHKEELTKIKTIWQSLQDHNDSIEFRNPVDYKGKDEIHFSDGAHWLSSVYKISHGFEYYSS